MNPLDMCRIARRAMPLMTPAARREVDAIVHAIERTSNSRPLDYTWFLDGAAYAFEEDLQPVRTAIASALHAGNMAALQALRHLLPGLLREVNQKPLLATVLHRAMARGLNFEANARTANAEARIGNVTIDGDEVVNEAMLQWRSREVFETDLSSAELRGFSRDLRNRSIFSARTTNAEYLAKVAETVDEILAGRMGMAEGRVQLMRKLKELGYDPALGFPGDWANIPPAEAGSLQDLSSERRIDLLLETNVRMAQGYAQVLAGNGEYARFAYPAWELARLYLREVPRGTPESKTAGWGQRWEDAGQAVNWDGALRDSLIARKDSPIWQALGDGEGGYTDTLLNPFPPFAFRSGMAWRAVSRDKAEALGLIGGDARPEPMTASLDPGEQEVVRIVDGMPPDLQAELERELGLA